MVHVRLNRNTDRSQYSPGPPVSFYSTAPPVSFYLPGTSYLDYLPGRNYSGGLQRGVKFGRRLEQVGRAIGRHLLAALALASFCARRFREISWRARRSAVGKKPVPYHAFQPSRKLPGLACARQHIIVICGTPDSVAHAGRWLGGPSRICCTRLPILNAPTWASPCSLSCGAPERRRRQRPDEGNVAEHRRF